MAAGIVLWSLFSGENVHGREDGARLINGNERAYLKQHLKFVLRDQVARTPPARHAIEGAIERIFTRAPIESRDARAWHMMMRALGSRATPPDFGLEDTEPRLRRKQAVRRAQEGARDRRRGRTASGSMTLGVGPRRPRVSASWPGAGAPRDR
jgi:hypothetical protein